MVKDGSTLCETCPNACHAKRRVLPDGTGSNGVLIVGESPWQQELSTGKPFAGAAGYQLEKLLRRIGAERKDFLITNSMWCLPPRLGWFQSKEAWEAINHCRPHLEDTIAEFKPRCILALGDTALRRLVGVSGMTEHHAYLHDSLYGPVIPTYHPSYLMQGNHKLSAAFMFAVRRALQVAAGKWERQPTSYVLDASLEHVSEYMRGWSPNQPLAFDIETPRSAKIVEDELEEDPSYEIVRVSFSYKAATGVSVPWTEPFIGYCKQLLALAQEVVFWNGSFDVPRLKAAGVRFGGRIVDAMWAWHFLQSDLPKGLGFVAPFYSDLEAWKHLSESQPAYYSAVDADATIRCFQGVRDDLELQGRWEAFERHCIEVTPLLDEMGRKGLVVDQEKQRQFKQRLEAELADAATRLQGLVPNAVKPLKVYKGVPGTARAYCKEHGLDIKALTELEFIREGSTYKLSLGEWTKRDPFNYDSPKQVAELIKHLGLPMPKDRKTGGESTGAKYLARFAKQHEVFKWILECRQRSDMLGTFIWSPNAEGRVGTQYGYHPSTWRKCVAKGTLVSTPEGEIPVEKLKAGQLVYTYDDNLKLMLKPIVWAGKTGHKKVIRLHWKAMGCHSIKGYLDVTPDHLVRLLDGSYKEAAKLQITWGRRRKTIAGDRILALHRGNFDGYVRLSGTGFPTHQTSMLEHRFVYWWHTSEWPEHVHHCNDVKADNRISNLAGMTRSEHLTLTGRRKGRRLRGREGWERWQLRKHLERTLYPHDVSFCDYHAANHRIVNIEELPTSADVYDVEVQDTHNFIANELCVHNSSRSVNLQNIPKRADLAKEFRKMLVASPGHVLIEADSSAIEAVLVGYAAGDPDYIRLAKAGVHDYLTAHLVGQPVDKSLPFDELKRQLSAVKKQFKEKREQAKRVIHGSNYKLSPYGMHDEYPEFFPTQKAAADMQNFYFGLFDSILKWHTATLGRAHKETFLDNHFGYRHYFYDVFTWNRDRGEWALGNDAKRAIAFVPQSDASAIQTEYLLALRRDEQVRRAMRLIIHDSLVLEVPHDEANEVAEKVYRVMTSPIPQLGGLSIGAEVQVGESLGEMSVMEFPEPIPLPVQEPACNLASLS